MSSIIDSWRGRSAECACSQINRGASLMSESESNVEVLPVAGRIGAEVRGVRLSADLSPGVVGRIREAWLKHKVLFFRGQQHLDEAAQESLTPIFGAAPVGH